MAGSETKKQDKHFRIPKVEEKNPKTTAVKDNPRQQIPNADRGGARGRGGQSDRGGRGGHQQFQGKGKGRGGTSAQLFCPFYQCQRQLQVGVNFCPDCGSEVPRRRDYSNPRGRGGRGAFRGNRGYGYGPGRGSQYTVDNRGRGSGTDTRGRGRGGSQHPGGTPPNKGAGGNNNNGNK